MGKFQFGLSSSAAEAELGQGFYHGDKPPKGVYKCVLKQLKVTMNKNNDPMFKLLLEVTEKDGSAKAKYNGYGIWQNLNVTDQGMPWVNNFVDAIGAKRTDIPNDNVTVDGEKVPNVLKIGVKKPVGLLLRVATKDGTDQNGNPRLDVAEFLLDAEDADDTSDDDGSEESVGLDDVDTDAEDADDTSDDAGSDDDAGELYTEEELTELSPAELREVLDEWSVEYAPKATSKTLIKLILQTQEAGDETAAEEEPASDEADADDSDDDALTEDELNEMEPAELKEYITEKGWDMPKPPVKSRLIKAILAAQAEPPF